MRRRQHLVPEADAAVDGVVDVVAGQELMFVAPTANALALQLIVKLARKAFVVVLRRSATQTLGDLGSSPAQHVGQHVGHPRPAACGASSSRRAASARPAWPAVSLLPLGNPGEQAGNVGDRCHFAILRMTAQLAADTTECRYCGTELDCPERRRVPNGGSARRLGE